MEKYKDWEKDSKTKEYSKEGLAKLKQVNKKIEEKQRAIDMLNDYIKQMIDLRTNYEAEVEKSKNKKKVRYQAEWQC